MKLARNMADGVTLELSPFSFSSLLDSIPLEYRDSYMVFELFPYDLLNRDYLQKDNGGVSQDGRGIAVCIDGVKYLYRLDRVPDFAFFSFQTSIKPERAAGSKIKFSYDSLVSIRKFMDSSVGDYAASLSDNSSEVLVVNKHGDTAVAKYSDSRFCYKLIPGFFMALLSGAVKSRTSCPSRRFIDTILEYLDSFVLNVSDSGNSIRIRGDSVELLLEARHKSDSEEDRKLLIYYDRSSGLWETAID